MLNWFKKRNKDWPSKQPVWTLTVLTLALGFWAVLIWNSLQSWTPLQRHWFMPYLSTTWTNNRETVLRMVLIEQPNGKLYWPTNNNTVPGQTRATDGKIIPFRLTHDLYTEGARLVVYPKYRVSTPYLREVFQSYAYNGLTLKDFLLQPVESALWNTSWLLICGMIVAIPLDRKRALIRKHGRYVDGPELVSAAEFNRRMKSDGVGFVTMEKPSVAERAMRREWQCVRIPRSTENHHGFGMGDTGTGKGVLQEQLAEQIEARDDAAIIYDPSLQLVRRFYNQTRGDVILNAIDQRMPYWPIAEEVQHPAEALTLATALFPDEPAENPFFVQGARKIMAYLLTLKPTPQELLSWLSDEKEIDRHLKGTPMAGMIYKSAGPQRGGMFGSLSMVADSLKLLPTSEKGKGRWTAIEWARRRRGWIFITSTPEVREQLRPFVSMWLDMLILRLMNQGRPGSRRVWFLLDEVQTLHRLPQLDTALFETRKSDDALFLFFQGRSQMQAIYGEKCQAMLSALKTKLFLATTEPEAAQWISDTIGNVEWERLEETRHDSQMPPHKVTYSYRVVNEKTPLVSRETFTGMRPGHAYLKFQNLVVKISFPYIGRPETQPGFILRESAMMMPQRKPPATDDGETSATSNGHEIWR